MKPVKRATRSKDDASNKGYKTKPLQYKEADSEVRLLKHLYSIDI